MSKKQSQTTQEAFQELWDALMGVFKQPIIFCIKNWWKIIVIISLFTICVELI